MDKVKAIKRINERMAVYQRQGLTDSSNYKKMVEKIKLLDLPYNEKNGKITLSGKKSDVSKINADDLAILDALPSLKQERKQAKEQGYKTTQEQNAYIKNRGSLETWINENMDFIYNDAKSGLPTAETLLEQFKTRGSGSTRNIDYSKIWSLIDKYETEKAKEFELLHNSSFYDDEMFED